MKVVLIENYASSKQLDVKFNVISNFKQYKQESFVQLRIIQGQFSINNIGESISCKVSGVFQKADMGDSSANYFFKNYGFTISMLKRCIPDLLKGNLLKFLT